MQSAPLATTIKQTKVHGMTEGANKYPMTRKIDAAKTDFFLLNLNAKSGTKNQNNDFFTLPV